MSNFKKMKLAIVFIADACSPLHKGHWQFLPLRKPTTIAATDTWREKAAVCVSEGVLLH